MDNELRVETAPDSNDIEALRDSLYRYNVASVGGLEAEELSVVVRGDDGELRAGLYGWTWGGFLEVNLLWVHEQERGHGLGSHMLAAAEAEGRARGAHTAILDTHTFQAPDFYRRHGYEVYATVEGYPAGHDKLFLRKRLLPADDVDTQTG
jgi:ribosomal protein S18 acetylase RimI-like enzyme